MPHPDPDATQDPRALSPLPHVVIAGGGFGGLARGVVNH